MVNGDFPWRLGVYDAHCHPTDTMESIKDIADMKARVLTVMATRAQDQDLVFRAAKELGLLPRPGVDHHHEPGSHERLIPSFGWHPWFSHQLFNDQDGEFKGLHELSIDQKVWHYKSVLAPKSDDSAFFSSLPDPRALSMFIAETRSRLQTFPLALVGEIGLDKSFRLPQTSHPGHDEQRDESLTPGGRQGRRLSPYKVTMDHQKTVLLAQLRLAGEMQRPVSLHGVQVHGVIFDALRETWRGHERPVLSKKERRRQGENDHVLFDDDISIEGDETKPYPPRACMHSFSAPSETLRQYLDPSVPCDFFFSFSSAVNFSSESTSRVEATIKAVPGDRLLVESDLHVAGPQMDECLQDIVGKVCSIKGWSLEQGIKILGANWESFVFGRQATRQPHQHDRRR